MQERIDPMDRKSKDIIALMNKADGEVLVKALNVLGEIGDEDSCNQITHYLDHEILGRYLTGCEMPSF